MVEEVKDKAISASNQVEVEVEAELGNNRKDEAKKIKENSE